MAELDFDKKVFGIGLSKTGTTSLTKSLNILGIHSIHYPWDQKTFDELQRGDYRLSVLNEYQGITDTPVAPFFAQLDTAWPGSKFILTVREKASWLRSAETHWKMLKEGRRANDEHFQNFADFISACVYGCVYFNAERFSYAYDSHVQRVQEYFRDRPDDFLVLDICGGTAGWPELSHFLGLPSPTNIRFPHEYRTREWAHLLTRASQELADAVPAGETVSVIDDDALGAEFGHGRRRLPFLERNGEYGGPPADDAEAIGELERQRTEVGSSFLVVGWSAFWWFEHYVRFTAHLQSRYDCILRNERLVIWALR